MTRAGATPRRWEARVALCAALCASAAGCKREGGAASGGGAATASDAARGGPASGAQGAAAGDGGAVVAARADAAGGGAANAGGAAAATGARATFQGHATGRGVDPPVHEFRPRITAESWSGNGAATLEVPAEGDGPVGGTVALGPVTFRVRGFRTGAHVRAVLDEAREGAASDGGAAEDVFRGTLDAEIAGTTLRGSWEASAEAGARRRQGTLEAQRQ